MKAPVFHESSGYESWHVNPEGGSHLSLRLCCAMCCCCCCCCRVAAA
ncbi:unnamed protein product [Spirodela intermedia]|uniref:Uncharacterized protein n=1 Tax=Spirodela intermedia TaxID=51605 RepID=A0A7I8K8F9_SPIIN|nr:unnamed protein product [Spirodela intermedia]